MNIRLIKKIIKESLMGLKDERAGFSSEFMQEDFSAEALETASQIRGDERGPAIIIQGVMPRSGTVYVGELIRLHPDVHAYPNEMWEIPFLEITGDIIKLQEHFFKAYKQNRERIGKNDFLPLFGSALTRHLFSFAPDNKRVLLKIPDVQYLNYFYKVFPKENILLLIRDGRDLVSSTMKSWPGANFKEICQLWDDSARIMLRFKNKHVDNMPGIMFSKYEDIINSPTDFMSVFCQTFDLDTTLYPYDQIENIAVRGSSTLRQESDKKNVSWDAISKPKNFKTTGHWHNWSRKEKAIFKKIAGKTLIELGYSENLDW